MRRWPCWPGPYSRRLTGLFGGPRCSRPCGGRSCTSLLALGHRVLVDLNCEVRALMFPSPELTGRAEASARHGSRNAARARPARRAGSRWKGEGVKSRRQSGLLKSKARKRNSKRRRGRSPEVNIACAACAGRSAADQPTRGGRWPGPDRASAPARDSRSKCSAAAGNGYRRARPCRCARASSTKQGAISSRIAWSATLAARAPLGERGEVRRADQRHVASCGEFADQRLGVFALDRSLGPEDRNKLLAKRRRPA